MPDAIVRAVRRCGHKPWPEATVTAINGLLGVESMSVLDEASFQALYGRWSPLDPPGVTTLLEGPRRSLVDRRGTRPGQCVAPASRGHRRGDLPCRSARFRRHRARQDQVGDALQARTQRPRDHLRRPYRPQRHQLDMTSYTEDRTLPYLAESSFATAGAGASPQLTGQADFWNPTARWDRLVRTAHLLYSDRHEADDLVRAILNMPGISRSEVAAKPTCGADDRANPAGCRRCPLYKRTQNQRSAGASGPCPGAGGENEPYLTAARIPDCGRGTDRSSSSDQRPAVAGDDRRGSQ